MIDIEFEVGGCKVSSRNLGNALERAVLQSIQDDVSMKLRSLVCPEHGQRPKVKAKGHSLDSLSFELAGCCERAIEAAKKKLK